MPWRSSASSGAQAPRAEANVAAAASAPRRPIMSGVAAASPDRPSVRERVNRDRDPVFGGALSRCPTTRSSGTPTRRISAASRDGRSGPSARCAACGRSIAARRSDSTAARGRAPWWRRPARRGLLAKMMRSISVSTAGFLMPMSCASRAVGRRRAPEVALLVAGRQRLAPRWR